MVRYRIKDWQRFQHYKNRRPPWIRYYHDTLEDPEICALSDRDYRILTQLWQVASEDKTLQGLLPSADVIAWKLRRTVEVIEESFKALTPWLATVEQDASNTRATREQVAVPEAEERREEKRQSAPVDLEEEDKTPKSRAGRLIDLCRQLWPDWAEMSVEQSLVILLPAIDAAGLDPFEVVKAARLAMSPEEPTFKAHRYINTQISIQRREQDRTRTKPPPARHCKGCGKELPPTGPDRCFECDEPGVPPTPEQQAEIERLLGRVGKSMSIGGDDA